MVTNAQARDRRKRLLEHMLETMKDVDEDRILATFSLKEKVSMAKAREYLRELKAARIVEQEVPISYPEA